MRPLLPGHRLPDLDDRRRSRDEEVEWRTLSWPTDFAYPTRARWTVHDNSRRFFHTSFHEIPGAGHQPWRERPDRLAAILTDLACATTTGIGF